MSNKKIWIASLVLLGLLTDSMANSEEDAKKAQKWEVYFSPNYVASKNLSFDGNTELDLNDRTGWSFGIGFNFSEYVSADVLFSSSNGSYSVSSVDTNGDPVNYSNNMYSSTVSLGMTYNIIDGPFTPYVSGNIGMTFIDSGVPDGTGTVGCWYDPWYGEICGTTTPTKTTTEFSYGASVGVRYDFQNLLFVKGGVGLNVVDLGSNNTPSFTVYQLMIGSKF